MFCALAPKAAAAIRRHEPKRVLKVFRAEEEAVEHIEEVWAKNVGKKQEDGRGEGKKR
jgi:uncharacterized protein YifE (UPF0438 family)